MFNVTLKGLRAQLPALRAARAHKRRLFGTFLAVFLGIAFLSGTLVLGDTLRANFDTLFADANAGTDAIVRSASTIEADGGRGPDVNGRSLIPSALADRVRSVPGVAAAEPSIEGYGQLIGRDGKAIGGNGPPRLAGNWITDSELNPYRLVEGRAPQAPEEVVVNRGAAEAGSLAVGDVTIVQTPEPVRVTIVGIATFGTGNGFGAVTFTFTAFTLAGAEAHVAKKPGVASSIVVRAAPGIDESDLAERIRPQAGDGNEVLTGAQFTAESTEQIGRQFLDLFTTFLTVFAGVALLVATFSIYNTLSILVAQRSRESALLRALGAAKAQILTSVVIEALLIGLVASSAGLLGGVGVAGLLKGLFDSFGFSLPAGGLVFHAGTAVICMAVGSIVTLVAGVLPAVKASRVAPVAALREHSVEATRASRLRAVAGAVLTGLGVTVVLSAVLGGGDSVLAMAGLGAVLTMVGVVVFGPVVARPAAGVVGWPLTRLRGVTGALARQNAMRNPRRTSGTAAALMVGVGVVTLFTVFAASVRSSIDDTVSRSFGGDLVVKTGSFGGGGLDPSLAPELAGLPEVRTAVGVGQGVVEVDGRGRRVTVADVASLGDVLDLDVQQGQIERLTDTQLAVSSDVGRAMGDTMSIRFVDGVTATFTVAAIYDVGDVAGDYLVSRTAWAPHAGQDVDSQVLVGLEDGVSLVDGKTAVTRVTEAAGGANVLDRKEYVASAAQGVDMMLGIVYVLLFLAIVIALMGIANTLSLAIHERTRELGLLRAVGQTRRQLRSMVRWESVIIALFGTVGGLGLGVFLGWALVQAASAEGFATFAAPSGQLAVVLVAGAVAGVLAGMGPARRAAKLDVLEAIGT